ncbi:rRNA biogenesis protein RRP5 [Thalictrum thalictroides]|uniref:rRNA biogenesis protein RRP5 n=1 Tax=Thalictrum thalictroides TaxID=46969 RepID=A0A7J6X063_THATH|nr:rRNA biogenesis protein RRP5 [Thalictrum thalictroides]
MYERTEQYKLVDELLEKMVKKFKRSCMQGKDGIQSIVKRAVVCLPHNKHIKFPSQTAILEFKCSVPDRGRSMFEEMLREYPKRTDLWSAYLDQFLFNKYMDYEKAHGDEEWIEYVRRKAIEYIESSLT